MRKHGRRARVSFESGFTRLIAQLTPGLTFTVRLSGLLTEVRQFVTRSKGEQFARCRLKDVSGSISLLVFPRAYAAAGTELKVGRKVEVAGRLSFKGEGESGGPELIVETIKPDLALH